MKRRTPGCPPWCGGPGSHYCTVWRGGHEHRSEPRAFRVAWGVLVVTRVQPLGRPGRLEVRLQVDLAVAELIARDQAEAVVREIDLAVTAALLAAAVTDAEQPLPPQLTT